MKLGKKIIALLLAAGLCASAVLSTFAANTPSVPRDVGDGGASTAKAQLAAGKEPVYDSPDDAYATPGTITLGSSFDPAKSPLIAWHDTDQTPEQAPLAVKLVACSPAWNINKAGKYDLTYEVVDKEGQAQPVLVHSSATVKPFAPLAANNLRAATPRAASSYKFSGSVKGSTSYSGADGFRGSTFRISAAGSGPLQTTINRSTWYCGNHNATTPQVGAGGNITLWPSTANSRLANTLYYIWRGAGGASMPAKLHAVSIAAGHPATSPGHNYYNEAMAIINNAPAAPAGSGYLEFEPGGSLQGCFAFYENTSSPPFPQDQPKYKLRVRKVDKDTKHYILGGAFQLFEEDKATPVGGVKACDTTGDVVWSNEELGGKYAPGTYWVKEVRAPANYPLPTGNAQWLKVEIKPHTTGLVETYYEFANSRTKTYVAQIHKQDGNGKGLSGAKFQMYMQQSLNSQKVGPVVSVDGSGDHMWTNDRKEAAAYPASYTIIPGLGARTYYIYEVQAPNGYSLPANRWTAITLKNTGVAANRVGKNVTNYLKRGGLKVVKSSEDGKKGGLKFRVRASGLQPGNQSFDKTVTTANDGTASLSNLLPGTYKVEEVGTPNRYVVPVAQSKGVAGGATVTYNFYNKLKRGNIRIVKASEDGMKGGLKFRVRASGLKPGNQSFDKTVTTANDGTASLSNLLPGTYKVEEVGTPNRYVVPVAQSKSVAGGATVTYNFYNKLKRGTLKIVKSSEDGMKGGLKFRVTASGLQPGNQSFDKTVTTANDGTASLSNLLPGTYKVEEVGTPNRYIVPVSQSKGVAGGATVTYNFYNKLKRGNIRIVKASEDGMKGGLKFRVTASGLQPGNQSFDKTVTTANDGTASLSNLLPGTYKVEEVGTPNRYVVPVAQRKSVAGGATVTYNFYNKLKRGTLKIVKSSEDGMKGGLKFRVTASGLQPGNQSFDKTVTTANDGTASLTNLLPGTYKVEEVGTPNRYIVPVAQSKGVAGGATVTYNFYNKLKRGNIVLYKVDKDDPHYNLPSGFSFTVYRDSNDNGKYDMGVDKSVGTMTRSGNRFYLNNQVYGRYFVKETGTHPYWYQDNTYHAVFISSNGMTYEVETAPAKDFQNTPKRGALKISKKANDGTSPLTGATFRLFRATDSWQPDKSLSWDATTDQNGVCQFSGLRYGKYLLYEVKVADGDGRYELIHAPIRYTVDDSTVKSGVYSVTVHDFVTPTLPHTGGLGLLPFFLVGGGVAAAAAIAIRKEKRKEKNNNEE